MMTSTFKQFTLLICKYLKSNSISRDGSSQKYSSPSQARDLDFKLKLYRAFVLFTSFVESYILIINFEFEKEKNSIELFKIRVGSIELEL